MEVFSLGFLKSKRKELIKKINEYMIDLGDVETALKKFKKCEYCEEPNEDDCLRVLTDTELNWVNSEDSDDSCCPTFHESELYCEKCISILYKCSFENCTQNCNGYDSDHGFDWCLECSKLYENCKCLS